jgi:hypothetical protein
MSLKSDAAKAWFSASSHFLTLHETGPFHLSPADSYPSVDSRALADVPSCH